MTLHLLKLSVGTDSVDDLAVWRRERRAMMQARGLEPQCYHVTRMVPRRIEELLDGGSIYWVIKGQIQVRQRLIDIDPFTDADGIRRCRIVMDDALIPTQWQPKRAFQGWRYLKASEAPADLGSHDAAVPGQLRSELAELGLL